MHTPGLKVVLPATPADAKGLLKTAIRDEDPIIFIESEALYGKKFEVPEGEHLVPFGLADVVHEGSDVTIIAHSLGGNVALRYAGIYPETVARLVAIEGLGPSPRQWAERAATSIDLRMDEWILEQRRLAGRLPRRYGSIEDAFRRMQEENPHLTAEQARHLTVHGVNQNEDGTYSWKFDNYVRSWLPYDMPAADVEGLWARITCPTLLVYGKESWASNPAEDGRATHFKNAEVIAFEGAGHWVHHDKLAEFLALTQRFLKAATNGA